MNLNGAQDWDQVVIRKKKPTNSQLKDEASVNAVSLAASRLECPCPPAGLLLTPLLRGFAGPKGWRGCGDREEG